MNLIAGTARNVTRRGRCAGKTCGRRRERSSRSADGSGAHVRRCRSDRAAGTVAACGRVSPPRTAPAAPALRRAAPDRRRRRRSRPRRSAPPVHVVIMPPASLDDRHQRLHVVGVERRLDHDVDQPHREQAIRVAIAAPAGEARAVGDPIERGALARGAEHLRDRCRRRRRRRRFGQRRVLQRAPLAAAPPFGSAARRRQERFADVRLVRDADDDAVAVVERDQRRPVHLAEDEAARAVDRVDHPRVVRRAALRRRAPRRECRGRDRRARSPRG